MSHSRTNFIDDSLIELHPKYDQRSWPSFIEGNSSYYLEAPPYYQLGPKNSLQKVLDWLSFCKPFLIFFFISLFSSLIFTFLNYSDDRWRCLYLLIILISSWIVNYVDVVVIGFIPLLFAPLLGIMTFKETALEYFSTTTVLYITASIIGGASQKVKLDKRFALYVMKGSSLQMYDVTLRFSLISGFLSIWISDTAAMTLLIPIAKQLLAIIYDFQDKIANEAIKDPRIIHPPQSKLTRRELQACSYIIIAYSTCIGGMSSMIGSTTNMAFMGIWEARFGYDTPLTFTSWFIYGMPCALLTLAACWVCMVLSWEGPIFFKDLVIYYYRKFYYFFSKTSPDLDNYSAIAYERFIYDSLPKQEKWTFSEISVLTCFLSLLLLLFTRNPGIPGFPGWDYFFSGYTHDAMVTTFIAVLFFFLPRYTHTEVDKLILEQPFSNTPYSQRTHLINERLLTWQEASRSVEWGIMWIFGAGFALAKMIVDTGLGKEIAMASANLFSHLDEFWMILFILISTGILTEFMSSTIVTQIFTPVLLEVSHSLELNPLLLSFNSVFASGSALLLPIASTSNVLAYKSANLSPSDFFRSGLLLKFISIFIILFCIYSYGYSMFDMQNLPSWAII